MATNRRRLLQGLVAAVASAGVAWPQARRYGAVTIERHRVLAAQGVYLRVYHQGCDVTARCYFADDTGQGMAKLFLHNAQGRPYLDRLRGEVAKEIVYGVTFAKGRPPR